MSFLSPVLIVGMHRSGTSCLTGCLEEAGLFLGDVNTEAPFNAKGNRENTQAMALHDSILRRVGAAWDNPPDTDPAWTVDELFQLSEIIAGYKDGPLPWGLKDPRSLFMLGAWRQLCNPRFVGTFRHPAEVAQSLMKRAKAWGQDMSLAQAHGLWLAYNQRLLALRNSAHFPIIRYDVAPSVYEAKLRLIAQALGLEMPQTLTFRESALRHHHTETQPVPPALQTVWEELNDIAV